MICLFFFVIGFIGSHSDIGGYAEGDLSDVALIWVINEARNAGINFKVPTKYTRVTSPIIHDSVKDSISFRPNREFLWAEQNSHGQTQFKAKSHLKLNWADTLRFQPEGQNKFQEIKEISNKYSEAGRATQVRHQLINQYAGLKKEGTILYGSNIPRQKINIDDYIQWLKDNGYAIGTSTNLSVD